MTNTWKDRFDNTFEAMLPYDGIWYKDGRNESIDDLEPIKKFISQERLSLINEIEEKVKEMKELKDDREQFESGNDRHLETDWGARERNMTKHSVRNGILQLLEKMKEDNGSSI